MHEQPEPTEEEQEQVPERVEEEDAMRAPGHEDPARSRRQPAERPSAKRTGGGDLGEPGGSPSDKR